MLCLLRNSLHSAHMMLQYLELQMYSQFALNISPAEQIKLALTIEYTVHILEDVDKDCSHTVSPEAHAPSSKFF